MVYLDFYSILTLSLIGFLLGVYLIIKSIKTIYVRNIFVEPKRNYEIVEEKEIISDLIQSYIFMYVIMFLIAFGIFCEDSEYSLTPIIISGVIFGVIGAFFSFIYDEIVRKPFRNLILLDYGHARYTVNYYSQNKYINNLTNILNADSDTFKKMNDIPGINNISIYPCTLLVCLTTADVGVFIGCIISLIMSFIK